MFRGQNNTALHVSLGQTGHNPYKIQYELGGGMRDYRQIGISTLSDIPIQFYIQLLFIFFHSYRIIQ